MKRRHLIAWLLLAAVAIGARADAAPSEAAIAGEIDAALARLAERQVLADTTIARPSRTRFELGAVVDVRAADPKGLAVLAVSPDGPAQRMGLRRGDRLLRVNGAEVARAPQPAIALVRAVGARDGNVALAVVRGDRNLALSGRADRIALPAYTLQIGAAAAGTGAAACGRISTFDVLPRAQRLFPVTVIAVDGRTPPTRGEVVRLPAGRHQLLLAERIDSDRFNAVQLKRRDLLGRDRYKTLEIDVAAGTTYQLAAELHGPERMRMAGGDYWSPKVWRSVPEACR